MLGDNIRTQQTAYLMHVAYNFGMAEKYFTIDSLKKSYSDKMIFDSLSCSFHSNGLYLLLGENGSGKSTLLNILSGKDTDYEGKVSYSGEELTEKDRESFSDSCVSYVAQDSLVFEDRKAIDDFLLPYEKKDRDKAKKILTDLGLGDVLDEKCKELSEGEKERLCFGQALYADKEIVLLDEITANLDPVSTERILKNILALSKDRLVIFATHDGMPDWFTKDAFILRRKDGKLSEEKEGSFLDSDHDAKAKKKHGFLLSNVLDARKEEKKTHWLVGALCFVLSALCVLFCSFYGSFKDTKKTGDDNRPVTEVTLDKVAKEVFFETSPVFVSRSKGEDSYSLVNLNYFSNCNDRDYRKAGSVFAGVFEYNGKDSDKPVLTKGSYPANSGEAIVSDVCFSYGSGHSLGEKRILGDKEYTIVGVYQSRNKDKLEARYSRRPVENDFVTRNKNVRICYSFRTESVFVKDDVQNSEFFARKTTEKNKESFLKDNFRQSDISYQSTYRNQYSPICVNSKGKETLNYFHGCLSNLIFGILSAVILLILLVVLGFSLYTKNKRKYILLRYRGTSRNCLVKGNLLSFSFTSFVSRALGIGVGEIILVIRNHVFDKELRTPSLLLFSSFNYSILILFGVFLVFNILLFVIYSNLLCPKDRSHLLEEVKKKA